MSKNLIVLLILAAILGGIYMYILGVFSKESIEIIPQIRPNMRAGGGRRGGPPANPDQASTYPVSFLLRGKWRLTTVKVVSADDLKTNKHPTALWHLISDSNSVPTKAFYYGERILGMKPAVPRARPDPLQPDVPYLLIVEAGKVKGQTNFFTREVVQAQ